MEPRIAFATRKDGARIAYATLGSGPPFVYPPGAFSRLRLDFTLPAFDDFYTAIAAEHTLILWDRHGVGHSDRDRTDFSIEDDIADLEAIVEALDLEHFPIFGVSDGGPIAITYAARHPEKVSCLVLYGTAASRESEVSARHAIAELIRTDVWLGMRAIMLKFVPSAPEDAVGPLATALAETSSSETTAAIWESTGSVTELIPRIQAPCLVMHRRDDHAVPFESGVQLARLLPNSRFLPLSGEDHPPIVGDWRAVFNAMSAFLNEVATGTWNPPAKLAPPHVDSPLTGRELEVLRLLGQGKSNPEIADELFISLNTVQNHLKNIYRKANLTNRAQAAVYAQHHGLV